MDEWMVRSKANQELTIFKNICFEKRNLNWSTCLHFNFGRQQF